MKDSEILRKVKKELMEFSFVIPNLGICKCIDTVVREQVSRKQNSKDNLKALTKLHRQGESLEEWVMSMLGHTLYLQGWLQREGHTKTRVSEWSSDYSLRKLRNTRLAWLDWMIAYCEAEELKKASKAKKKRKMNS